MESKLYEECHEGGGFMAQQAMLKQDETVRTQIPTMKPLDNKNDSQKKEEEPAKVEEPKTVEAPAEKAEKEEKPSFDPEIK